MITRRQWAGRARVLQVLNLIGPEGPIAPGKEPQGGTPGRNPREEPQGGTPRKEPRGGTSGRKPGEGRKYQAHRPHSTTAPQHHRPPQLHNTTGHTAPQAT